MWTLFPTSYISIWLEFAVLFFYGIEKNHKTLYTREERSKQIGNYCRRQFFVFRFSNGSKSNWAVELCDSSHKYRWKMERSSLWVCVSQDDRTLITLRNTEHVHKQPIWIMVMIMKHTQECGIIDTKCRNNGIFHFCTTAHWAICVRLIFQ